VSSIPVARRVLRSLGALVALLVLADWAGRTLTLIAAPTGVAAVFVEATRLEAERGVANWVSIALLAAAATLLTLLARRDRRAGAPFWRHWLGLAAIALLLSFDEQVGLFESSAEKVTALAATVGIPPVGVWLLPASMVILALALLYHPMLAGLPRPIAGRLAHAALVYTGGAVGLELVSTFLGSVDPGWGPTGLALRDALFAGEEALELAGISLGVVALVELLTGTLADGRPVPESVPRERRVSRRDRASSSSRAARGTRTAAS
jgi:hypothetical protein